MVLKSTENLIGRRVNKLVVIGYAGVSNGHNKWNCKCDCGQETVKYQFQINKGIAKSCGCLHKLGGSRRHHMTKTPFYKARSGIKRRCNKTDSEQYKNYGGRGIKVCETRGNKRGFDAFHKDMYESYLEHIKLYGEKATTIDRIDVNGDYCKENCRWATMREQANNRRNNHIIEYNGEIFTLSKLVEKLGLSRRRVTTLLKKYPLIYKTI